MTWARYRFSAATVADPIAPVAPVTTTVGMMLGVLIVSAHQGYPRWVNSGADFIEIDIRSTGDGTFIVSHDAPQPGDHLVRLDEVLEAAGGRVGLHLDLKEHGNEIELLRFVLGRYTIDKLVVTAEEGESIRKIKRSFPQLRVGLTRRHVERSDADFVALDQAYASEDDLNSGIPIWVWTVDDKKRMQRFVADKRINGLITNRPDLALKLRSARS